MWLFLVALAILGVIVLLLMGRWDGAPAPQEESGASHQGPTRDQLSAGEITPEHLEEVRFDSALRGYRMDQVDALLDTLARQLREARGEDHSEADVRPRNDPR